MPIWTERSASCARLASLLSAWARWSRLLPATNSSSCVADPPAEPGVGLGIGRNRRRLEPVHGAQAEVERHRIAEVHRGAEEDLIVWIVAERRRAGGVGRAGFEPEALAEQVDSGAQPPPGPRLPVPPRLDAVGMAGEAVAQPDRKGDGDELGGADVVVEVEDRPKPKPRWCRSAGRDSRPRRRSASRNGIRSPPPGTALRRGCGRSATAS